MRLEYALTVNDPRSVMVSVIQAKSTGRSHLSKVDVMTVLGICQARKGLGLSLMYAKYTKDKVETASALKELQPVATSLWVTGDASRGLKGNGSLVDKRHALAIRCLAALALEDYCRTVDTAGAMCRCKGRGRVVDPVSREFPDEPGIKTCPRCHGLGVTPFPASRVYRTVNKLIPELPQSTFYAKWKLIYDLLVERCYQEESTVEQEYKILSSIIC